MSFYQYTDDTIVLQDELSIHQEELKYLGYTVLENILSPSEVERYKNKCLDIYSQLETEVYGRDLLEKVKELDMLRAPLAYDESFLDLALETRVNQLVKSILGDYYILHLQNAIINRPNIEHHQRLWHRDLPYQNYVINKPLSISVLITLVDFNSKTGGTEVVASSHLMDPLPSINFIDKFAISTNIPAGSALVFDSMLLHRAGFNSSDQIRIGINNIYTSPIIKQQLDLFSMLQGRYQENPELSKFLGYDSRTVLDDKAWKERRLNRL